MRGKREGPRATGAETVGPCTHTGRQSCLECHGPGHGVQTLVAKTAYIPQLRVATRILKMPFAACEQVVPGHVSGCVVISTPDEGLLEKDKIFRPVGDRDVVAPYRRIAADVLARLL